MEIALELFYEKGWIEIQNIRSDSDLINLSSQIGRIIPHPNGDLIFNLMPKSAETSIKGTFSNRYGFGNFPLHTDTAFWYTPTRYLLLFSVNASSCNTTLVSFNEILKEVGTVEIEFAEKAIFKIVTPHIQFYTSLFFHEDDTLGVRYDISCMKPMNSSAKKIVKIIEEIKPKVKEINWSGSNAVLIDNWKVLHGRNSFESIENRLLKRIYINKK